MSNAKNERKRASLAMRIAAAMDAMGIEGLPRNFELVYEVYTGSDADLVRDFKGLGIYKSQQALDALGRRYLPHHFAVGELEDQAGRIREEMALLLGVLEEEQAALESYGDLVGRTAATLSTGPGAQAGQTLDVLTAATRDRHARTLSLSEQVAGQKAALDAVSASIQDTDRQKFTDPLTGLGNRRLFNRALAEIFKTENAVSDFAVMVADLDPAGRLNPRDVAANAAKVMRSALPHQARLCRFDGLRFGVLYLETSQELVHQLGKRVQEALANYGSGISAVHKGVKALPSVGICMYSAAADAFDIVSLAERALREGQQAGAEVAFHGAPGGRGQGKDFALYRPH